MECKPSPAVFSIATFLSYFLVHASPRFEQVIWWLSLVGTGVAFWTTFGTPEMHESWVLPAWIGLMALIHGGIAGWNFYIKNDPERTPLLA